MKTIYLKSIDSTNTYLKSNYLSLDHMTWLSADHQTKGKGRSNKHWFGDSDSLMCSVLLKTNLDYEKIQMLPLLAAKSLHQVLSKYHSNIKIKWPNDLLIDDLKLSGILVESIIEENQVRAVIIGFGVNINNPSFNEEIKDIATSLSLATKSNYDKEPIYQHLINQFESDYDIFLSNTKSIIEYSNQHSALNDKQITFSHQGEIVHAKVVHVKDDGHLLVETKTQQMSLYSSEISLIK